MLFRKFAKGQEQVEDVSALPAPGERTEIAQVLPGIKSQIDRAADMLFRIQTVGDMATLNDHLLRICLQFPPHMLQTELVREQAVDRVMTMLRDAVANRYPGTPQDSASEHTRRLRACIRQLSGFVAGERQRELTNPGGPSSVFATSVDLDIDYGIDLIRARGWWQPEKNRLLVGLMFYQAKASYQGLSNEDVRRFAREYKNKLEEASRLHPLDEAGFISAMFERTQNMQEGALLRALGNMDAATLLLKRMKLNPPRTAWDQFVYADRTARLRKVFQLPDAPMLEVPTVCVVPNAEVRLLVDIAKVGTRVLTLEEAMQFPEPVVRTDGSRRPAQPRPPARAEQQPQAAASK